MSATAAEPTLSPETLRRLQRVSRVARMMDSQFQIPGTKWRFGLDPLIGLLPGVGDGGSALVSLWIVLEAKRLGVPTSKLWRMLWNVLVDTMVGSVPLVGDILDVGYKANHKNVALMEEALGRAPLESTQHA